MITLHLRPPTGNPNLASTALRDAPPLLQPKADLKPGGRPLPWLPGSGGPPLRTSAV